MQQEIMEQEQLVSHAAILQELKNPLTIEKVKIPMLLPGQVQVKILFSGVCHSQLNEVLGTKGPDPYLPHLLGHEGAGIVEAVGPGVSKVKNGDYVVLTWIKSSGANVNASCFHDQLGEITYNSGSIATFATRSVISENRLVVISSKIPPQIATLLGCAVPTGAGIIKNEIGPQGAGKTLVIFGIGGVGASALLYAKSQSFSTIIAVDITEEKLRFAKEIGATHVINSLKEDVLLSLQKYLDSSLADFAVECTGVTSVMQQAISSVKSSGKVVIAGNPRKGEKLEVDPYDLISGKKIVGTWGGASNPDEDVPYYADLYLQGTLKLDSLISKVYPLAQVNQALNDLRERKVTRALLDCSSSAFS